ncbi:hypothetical protein G6F68_010001 [Rhizopus microsporus]|nr:hypothetical protein G6F68_010001 [Rhizopus microsporus]
MQASEGVTKNDKFPSVTERSAALPLTGVVHVLNATIAGKNRIRPRALRSAEPIQRAGVQRSGVNGSAGSTIQPQADTEPHQEQAGHAAQCIADPRVLDQAATGQVAHADQHRAVGAAAHQDAAGQCREGGDALVRLRVDEQRQERHVEQDRLRIEQADQDGLLEVAARLHADRPGVPPFVLRGSQQADADPHQVGRTEVLHGMEHQRIGLQQCGHAGQGQPHQDLVADQQAGQCGVAATHAATAGGGQQGEGTGAGQGEEHQHGDQKRPQVLDAHPRHGEGWRGRRACQTAAVAGAGAAARAAAAPPARTACDAGTPAAAECCCQRRRAAAADARPAHPRAGPARICR